MSVELRGVVVTAQEAMAETARLLARRSELSRYAELWQRPEFLAGLSRQAEMWHNQEFLDRLSRHADVWQNQEFLDGLSRHAEQFEAASRQAENFARTFERTHQQAIAAICSIGRAVNAAQPFAKSATALLRANLGDWRAVQNWPDAIFRDPLARADFYRSLGFAEHLTTFPEPDFHGILDAADLAADEDEILTLNCDAYSLLLRFERKLRRFVDEAMTRRFGPAWVKHRVPGDIAQNWKKKRQDARHAREPERPLIEYADFTDYILIIERRDNWREVFRPVFGRREDIQEAFHRLRPIRLSTMHARLITNDDALLLCVETRRILKAIEPIS